jgi:hypothetical protein
MKTQSHTKTYKKLKIVEDVLDNNVCYVDIIEPNYSDCLEFIMRRS